MNKTFAMIKPDAVAANTTGALLADICALGFRVEAMTMRPLTRKEAEQLYSEHQAKGHFPDLINFMTSGNVVLLSLVNTYEDGDASAKLRWFIGPADASERQVWHLRSKYATDVRRNAIHASDGNAAARRELELFGLL